MSKKQNISLGYLGYTFQVKLVKQFIEDHKFANGIIEMMDPQYFDNEFLRLLIASVKNYYEKYETIPTYDTIRQLISIEVKREIALEQTIATLKEVEDCDNIDCLHIQETAIKFCKQQELKKANLTIQKILEKGDFDRYDECEEILKNALNIGDEKDDGMDVFHAIDDVLSDDFRNPIPTGINGLDKLMDGGLSKGELGVILASFGVGKSTLVTRMANTAYNLGYNVVQIFFEDNPKVIQRKHITCWTEIPLNELTDRREEVMSILPKYKNEQRKNNLILKKMSSDGTTIPMIKQYLRKLISNGIKPDIIFLDYIDCVQPTKLFKDEYSGEGNIMRQFETMISELNVAGWTAIQGNRCCSLDTDIQTLRLGKHKIKDVVIGDEILTHDGYKKVTDVFPIEKQQVYKIKTKSGKEIKVSAKHDFPVDSGVLKSIRTGLSIGDKLLIKK